MRLIRWLLAVPAVVALLGLPRASASADGSESRGRLPDFTHTAPGDWLNSPPLTATALRGRPTLVEVWTFDCSNCLASIPWMKHVLAIYGPRGLQIVAVHTPELPQERDPAAVARAVAQLGIRYPVMVDGDASYWRALGNRYWPAFYVFDADGREVARAVGELHPGDPGAVAVERRIESALPAGEPRP